MYLDAALLIFHVSTILVCLFHFWPHLKLIQNRNNYSTVSSTWFVIWQIEQAVQQNAATQSPPLLPSIPYLSRTFPLISIVEINVQMPPPPRKSSKLKYLYSNPSSPIFSARSRFDIGGQQHVKQPDMYKEVYLNKTKHFS